MAFSLLLDVFFMVSYCLLRINYGCLQSRNYVNYSFMMLDRIFTSWLNFTLRTYSKYLMYRIMFYFLNCFDFLVCIFLKINAMALLLDVCFVDWLIM